MNNNKLLIAAAGSGKTTYLINQALDIKTENVLITTYTEANEEEIRKKIVEKNGCIPYNIKIQTWFSFLLQHGVRPYQSVMNDGLHEIKIGFYLTEKQSGYRFINKNGKPVYWGEQDFSRYYFTKDFKIYSDKISNFIVKCNEKTKGEVLKRISRIFPNIFIDEVQDLAGWELEILKLLFCSNSKVLLVGDPRQVTYLTHHPRKYAKYKYGEIEKFIITECTKNLCEVDKITLNQTHRNNKYICEFSSKLFPKYDSCEPCECDKCRNYKEEHEGVFFIKEKDVKQYCNKYNPTILRWEKAVFPEWNFGKSKGQTFERVLIYPTNPILNWIKDNNQTLPFTSRCKFYVALTRAKYSVGIVYNYKDSEKLEGIKKYIPLEFEK